MAAPDVSTLQLGEIVVSGKGSKTAPIHCNGNEVVLTLEAPIAFEPSAYGDADKSATRVNLVLRCSEQDMVVDLVNLGGGALCWLLLGAHC